MIRWMLKRWGVALAALVSTLTSVALSGAVTATLIYVLDGVVSSRAIAIGMGVAALITPVFATIALRLVYELDQAHATVRALSITDPLTGANNRRMLIEQVEIEISRSRRYGGALGLLLLDVDNLKQVNDTLGHQAGDAMLVDLARTCAALCRESDSFARLGGDEFAFLLPNATQQGLATFAERVLAAVRGLTTDYGAARIATRVSLGTALLAPEDAELTQLLRQADAALYEAKRSGGDTVRHN